MMNTDYSSVKLGKQSPRVDKRTFKLAKYIDIPKLPYIPKERDWTTKCKYHFGMMQNNKIGNCSVAAFAHFIQVATSNSGTEIIFPDSSIIATYSAITGYTLGKPDTDNGAVLLDALSYLRHTGIDGHKIYAYASIDFHNPCEVKAAAELFGGVYVGFDLPKSAQRQKIWTKSSGRNGKPGTWGGHCVSIPAFTSSKYTCITWGEKKELTQSFFDEYVDEAYAILTTDWLNEQGHNPHGFSLVELQADLQLVKEV